jgi:hypothetical protein
MCDNMSANNHDYNIHARNILKIRNLNIHFRPQHEVQILTQMFSQCCEGPIIAYIHRELEPMVVFTPMSLISGKPNAQHLMKTAVRSVV